MTGVTLELNWDAGTMEAAQAAFRSLEAFDGTRSAAMWAAIGGYGVSSTQLRFDAQVGPDGDPWKPSQRAIKEDGKTLIWHGYLIRSITYNVLGEGVEWGSPLAYAAAMQAGAHITSFARSQQTYRKAGRDGLSARFVKKAKSNFASWATIPEYEIAIEARPYLGLNAQDGQEIADTALRHLDQAWQGSVH
jgi:phage gpG-like protein